VCCPHPRPSLRTCRCGDGSRRRVGYVYHGGQRRGGCAFVHPPSLRLTAAWTVWRLERVVTHVGYPRLVLCGSVVQLSQG